MALIKCSMTRLISVRIGAFGHYFINDLVAEGRTMFSLFFVVPYSYYELNSLGPSPGHENAGS